MQGREHRRPEAGSISCRATMRLDLALWNVELLVDAVAVAVRRQYPSTWHPV